MYTNKIQFLYSWKKSVFFYHSLNLHSMTADNVSTNKCILDKYFVEQDIHKIVKHTTIYDCTNGRIINLLFSFNIL